MSPTSIFLPTLIRVYADTSVYGGVFDEKFREASEGFFEKVRGRKLGLVLSTVVRDELEDAPQEMKSFFAVIRRHGEIVEVTKEVIHTSAGLSGCRDR